MVSLRGLGCLESFSFPTQPGGLPLGCWVKGPAHKAGGACNPAAKSIHVVELWISAAGGSRSDEAENGLRSS